MLVSVIIVLFLHFTRMGNDLIYFKSGGKRVIEKLRNKTIYDDFLLNVNLTEEQIEILNRLIKKEIIVKISLEMGISERTVKYEIKKIKQLYSDYCEFQVLKTKLLLK